MTIDHTYDDQNRLIRVEYKDIGRIDYTYDPAGNILTIVKTDYDQDNDGHPDTADAFPSDPTEWADTDQDNIGNNTDDDDDNDLLTDLDELAENLDPLDPDWDGDGVMDGLDRLPKTPSNVCSTLGNTANLENLNILSGQTITCAALQSITIAPTVNFESGGMLELISPTIFWSPSFQLPLGAEVSASSRSPMP